MAYFRFICILVFCLVLALSFIILWPWIHAAFVWKGSTILSLDNSLDNYHDGRIPKILHQTYRSQSSIPYQWQQASNSCRTLHSNYEYKFWTDSDGRQLIESHFPSLLPTFDSYPYNIQRVDVIRLVVLYVYGGIYLDMDIFCLKPLDNLLKYEFILPKTTPVGLSNDILLSQAKHPFLLYMINNLPSANLKYLTKYPTVMFTTGPMFLTSQASSYKQRQSLDILSPELYGKYVHNSSLALFRHLKASSWHGNDASMIKSIYRHRYIILGIFVMVLSMIITSILIVQKYFDIYQQRKYTFIFGINEQKYPIKSPKYRKFLHLLLVNFMFILLFCFNRLE